MIAHVISVVVALKNGLGTSPALAARIDNSDDLAKAGSATLAAYMLLIVALALAKGSTIMFVQRILSRDLRQLYLVCYGLLAVFAFWAVGSMIALGVACEGSGYVSEDMVTVCGRQGTRWAIISAFDSLTELFLILMPSIVVWPLQLSFNLKVQVVTAFVFRAGYVAPAPVPLRPMLTRMRKVSPAWPSRTRCTALESQHNLVLVSLSCRHSHWQKPSCAGR
jgi:hypothetical protein